MVLGGNIFPKRKRSLSLRGRKCEEWKSRVPSFQKYGKNWFISDSK